MDPLISVSAELAPECFFSLYAIQVFKYSDSFCSLTCWDIKVSDPLCPARLVSQSASSEATHDKGGLEPDSFIKFFKINFVSVGKQGNKYTSNEFSTI